ncbi:tripeptidyl peptidase ii [Wolffia australiana]
MHLAGLNSQTWSCSNRIPRWPSSSRSAIFAAHLRRFNRAKRRGMPSSSSSIPNSAPSIEKEEVLSSFRLIESTFIASLMPKKEIGADRFIESHPEYDGRGTLIAIFDSGVDPAANGLQVTSDGKPKIVDIIDCTGSGDIDTSTVVKADGEGYITGKSGIRLKLNASWKNPSEEWHVGSKLVYELFTDTLVSRIKEERKKKWEEKNQEAISEALKHLNDFEKKHIKIDEPSLKSVRDDLQNKVDFLTKQAEIYDDRGPDINVVAWHDGDVWRAALDTQSIENVPEKGRLADFIPLTNFRYERKYGIFSSLDVCSFVVNIYDAGNIVSIVTDSSPHGTHVAGITAAFHPEEPLLNGVAPGAQLISCKIGDSRLGSMETGTGLVRALIAAVEHKCDLINMSYGEPTLLPDYGRFVDLVHEAVDKHRIIFVSSAGNNGPALTTVGAPGGTTSSIIGVGAYLSPDMAAGAHSVVDPPSEGLEYTWSSRGPTADGDLGVSISAPGGAVAPVPTWTLQRRMLMNGTSMASPSACGGVSLLISGMKAKGIIVSPYSVRKALENTASPVGNNLEDTLSVGHGLLQVDKAFDYILQSQNLPKVHYSLKINQVGKTSPLLRGIYLRESHACQQPSEWAVKVEVNFHEDANKLEQLVPFEEYIQLHSTESSIIQIPEFLLLTHNGRTFSIVIDPSKLKEGLHYHEVYGTDCRAPWRGPLFRVPITITKSSSLESQSPAVLLSQVSFFPGVIVRRFIDVPHGATWVEATMRTSGFDTARRFFIDAVQLRPLERPIKWESVVTFSSPSNKTFSFPVKSALTMELTVSQFWSSGVGSIEPTMVDLEVMFHGINISEETVLIDGSEGPVRIVAKSMLTSEKLTPVATLQTVKTPYRPSESSLATLPDNRDRLPSGKQTLALTLTYKFKLEDAAEVKPSIPMLNDRIYDTKFESQFYMISDSNKRVYTAGDVYPKYVKIPKGDYILQLYLRHENAHLLEEMKQLVLFIERKLERKDFLKLNFFSQPDGLLAGDATFKSSILIPGGEEAFYVAAPSGEILKKNVAPGSVFCGEISYGKISNGGKNGEGPAPVSYQILCIAPPSKTNGSKGRESASFTKSVPERLQEEVRDAKIKFLSSLKRESTEEKLAWKELSLSLQSEYPKHTPLLAKILDGLISQSPDEDKISHEKEIISVANNVIESIDKDDLAKYFSAKFDPEDDEAEKVKKRMEETRDQLAEALYRKGLALDKIDSAERTPADSSEATEEKESDSPPKDLFEENFKELKKWVDINTSKYGILSVIRERRRGRLGTALKILNSVIEDQGEPAKRKLYDLKIELLAEIGWNHVVEYEKQWLHVRFPQSLPLF